MRQDILLGPAQRADVVVDFRGERGKDVCCRASRAPTAATGTGVAGGADHAVPGPRRSADRSSGPARAAPGPRSMRTPKQGRQVWTFGLTKDRHGSFWTINGKRVRPEAGRPPGAPGPTQLWQLRNTSDDDPLRPPARGAVAHGSAATASAPPPWERGLEDTWRLDPGERVVVAARFTDYTGVFMIHCHMLDHEDDGMMAQFAVVSPKSGKLPKGYTYVPKGGPAARA